MTNFRSTIMPPYGLQIFAKFLLRSLLLLAQCCLSLCLPSLLAWPLSVSIGSWAQSLWLSGSVDLLLDLALSWLLPVCLQVPLLASGSTCLALAPWLVEWWSGDKPARALMQCEWFFCCDKLFLTSMWFASC